MLRLVRNRPLVHIEGKLTKTGGLLLVSDGPPVPLGEVCVIDAATPLYAEVTGFRGDQLVLLPLGETGHLQAGMRVRHVAGGLPVPLGEGLVGRVLDGLGRPIDGKGPLQGVQEGAVDHAVADPLRRRMIDRPFVTGIRAIDGLLTLGEGQRVGVFAGSGVGKSTLLGMVARNALADINVIALIGERGREVREFLEDDLGAQGLARSVVVVATSDQPPMVRVKAAFVATRIAEFFRDRGGQVLFLMDSVTRFCMAQREAGLAIGEPPATRGYPPSVFSRLPALLERTGAGEKGAITAFYTVLVEGDDMNEPVADAVRGILDGHIVLSRELANRRHFPAIDVLQSVSRLRTRVLAAPERQLSDAALQLLAVYEEAREMVEIGAYPLGSNRRWDEAIAVHEPLEAFLCQSPEEKSDLQGCFHTLQHVLSPLQKEKSA
ncbi:MAG: FliI/YscN family ATPase [Firmicutes bacterium]|nr:FliI/YscN family ATPase [Bacillota bacterium]